MVVSLTHWTMLEFTRRVERSSLRIPRVFVGFHIPLLLLTAFRYDFLGAFRPPPLVNKIYINLSILKAALFQLPNQVYRFDPKTREVHVVADGFIIPNGIAFSPDGNLAYVYVL